MEPFLIFLFLHILGAVAAFGPGFASMIVGPMVAKEPVHANFYARTQVATGRKLITPVAIVVLLSGIAMILVRGWATLTAGRHWLELGILLYVVALVLAMLVQAPAGRKLVELTSTAPAPGTPPNPEIPKIARRVRTVGMTMSALTVIIVFLMVVKPF